MTVSAEQEGAFQEVFLCSIQKLGGTEYQFAGIIEGDSLSFEQGDKDGEQINTGTGGNIWKRTEEKEYEIKMKIYPLSLNVAHSKDMAQYFLGGTYDTSSPISQLNTTDRDLFRVCILFQDYAYPSYGIIASGTTGTHNAARRVTFYDARLVSYKESFGDRQLSVDVTFKGPAFNRAGTGNIKRESVISTDSAGLPALTAYT